MCKEFTEEMVDDYASKLLIGLTKEENNMVLEEFKIIDETINKINAIEGIEKVEAMTHCLDDFTYNLREDVIEESCNIDDILKNCDVYSDRQIEVPKVVTDNEVDE